MSPHAFDNIALILALLAIALRYWDRPAAANLCSSFCLASATMAGWLARRPRPVISPKQPAIANEAKGP